MQAGRLSLLSLLLLGSTATVDALAGAWDSSSNPFIIDPRFEARLSLLPTSARLRDSHTPWSGPYWADRRGSIGYSWQTGEKAEFLLLPAEALRHLDPARLARLSPAEKIDILRGRYDYPTVALVREGTRGRARAWEGLCTGWSQTSLLYQEPAPITLTNPQGIEVPFGSADLKALAAFYYDKVAVRTRADGLEIDERRVVQMGKVCDPGDPVADCRRDVNAGALHILVANRIGNQNRGVIADFSRGRQIWQHPIHGFRADIRGERRARKDAAPTAVREVYVHLELDLARYAPAQWETTGLHERDRGFRYWLELDSEDRIVGGKFLSLGGGRALDYLWVSDLIAFENDYEILGDLLIPRR